MDWLVSWTSPKHLWVLNSFWIVKKYVLRNFIFISKHLRTYFYWFLWKESGIFCIEFYTCKNWPINGCKCVLFPSRAFVLLPEVHFVIPSLNPLSKFLTSKTESTVSLFWYPPWRIFIWRISTMTFHKFTGDIKSSISSNIKLINSCWILFNC